MSFMVMTTQKCRPLLGTWNGLDFRLLSCMSRPAPGLRLSRSLKPMLTWPLLSTPTMPDDIGGTVGGSQSARARQNVVLELGYFLGKLGRKRNCALVVEGVEIPSDFSGVVYIPMDANGAWSLILRENSRRQASKSISKEYSSDFSGVFSAQDIACSRFSQRAQWISCFFAHTSQNSARVCMLRYRLRQLCSQGNYLLYS